MPQRLYNSQLSDLQEVAALLRAGKLAALPTETVYGLAGDALNVETVRAIFHTKGRPLIDPLIVHVRDLAHADEVAQLNQHARDLAAAFWPGPLTMVLPRRAAISDLVTAGQWTVAVRCPAHLIFQKILELSRLALAAPSANPFGYISPTRIEHVVQMLGSKIECFVDGGPCAHGVESTIVDLSQTRVRVLRPGPIGARAISASLGEGVEGVPRGSKASDGLPQRAPGMLTRHYSPRTPAHLVEAFSVGLKKSACVFLKRPESQTAAQLESCGAGVFWLSESGQVEEMAQTLYDLLHRLDAGGFKRLLIEKPSSSLVGAEALLDRLTRACQA